MKSHSPRRFLCKVLGFLFRNGGGSPCQVLLTKIFKETFVFLLSALDRYISIE